MRKIIIRYAPWFVGLVLALAVPYVGVAQAATDTPKDKPKTSDTAATETKTEGTPQAHGADSVLQIGTMVQLQDGADNKVKPATFAKATQMYGVVVDERKLSLTITSANLTNQVFVAATGTYPVLVSTQNGPIKTGDYITVSAVDGIGMLAEPEQKIVFGRAVSAFDGKADVIGNVDLKNTEGKSVGKTAIGSISVVIDIRHNPNEKSTKANVPPILQRLGEAIAEKPVGPLRIYLSIAITGISIVAAIALLYSGVRNSLISIGRNPLSKKSIFRALIEIILTSLIILIVGLFTVYLLLKL